MSDPRIPSAGTANPGALPLGGTAGGPPGGLPAGPPPGGPPRPGGPAGVAGQVKQMQSLFNPADLAAMLQRGEITPQTKFGEVLAKMGISPEDTLMEVIQKTLQERDKGNPLEKMKALSPGAPSTPPGAPSAMPPGGPPSLPGGPEMPSVPAGRRPSRSMGELFPGAR